MIGFSLTGRDRGTLAAGGAVITVLIIVFRALPAWRTWRGDTRAAASEMLSQARLVEAAVAGFPAAADSLQARITRLLREGPGLVAGDTPTEAAANLAALIAEVARQSSVRLDAVEVHVDTSRTHLLPRVTVDAQATGDIVGLAALLRHLDQGPTLLAVRRLLVRPQATAGPPGQVETLTIRIAVEGLALVPGGDKRRDRA